MEQTCQSYIYIYIYTLVLISAWSFGLVTSAYVRTTGRGKYSRHAESVQEHLGIIDRSWLDTLWCLYTGIQDVVPGLCIYITMLDHKLWIHTFIQYIKTYRIVKYAKLKARRRGGWHFYLGTRPWLSQSNGWAGFVQGAMCFLLLSSQLESICKAYRINLQSKFRYCVNTVTVNRLWTRVFYLFINWRFTPYSRK